VKPRAVTTSLVVLAACAGAGQAGMVERAPGAVTADPRPADCSIEFVYSPPTRAYDVLGDLTNHVTAVPPEGAQETLRPKACKLGADAVIITRNQVLNLFDHRLVEGTAIKYKAAPPAAPAPAPEQKPAPQPAAPPPAATPAPQPPATGQ